MVTTLGNLYSIWARQLKSDLPLQHMEREMCLHHNSSVKYVFLLILAFYLNDLSCVWTQICSAGSLNLENYFVPEFTSTKSKSRGYYIPPPTSNTNMNNYSYSSSFIFRLQHGWKMDVWVWKLDVENWFSNSQKSYWVREIFYLSTTNF